MKSTEAYTDWAKVLLTNTLLKILGSFILQSSKQKLFTIAAIVELEGSSPSWRTFPTRATTERVQRGTI